jgi:hypothetical protein
MHRDFYVEVEVVPVEVVQKIEPVKLPVKEVRVKTFDEEFPALVPAKPKIKTKAACKPEPVPYEPDTATPGTRSMLSECGSVDTLGSSSVPEIKTISSGASDCGSDKTILSDDSTKGRLPPGLEEFLDEIICEEDLLPRWLLVEI